MVDALPHEYRERHLEIAALIRSLRDGNQLSSDEEQRLATTGASIGEIREKLKIADELDKDDEAGALDEEGGEAAAQEATVPDEPSIICTSLVGAKGLSGGYIYIVTCNNGHFPQDPHAITDEEVCCFLVALSRTRKECQLISCSNNFSGNWMEPSRLLDWIDVHVDEATIDAAWFHTH